MATRKNKIIAAEKINVRDIVEKYILDVAAGNIKSNLSLHGWAVATAPLLSGWAWHKVQAYADFVSLVTQAAGSNAGKPLVLLPWQWAVAAQLLADPGCKALLVVVARGAGKTELAASLLAYVMITGGASQQYYAVAPNLRAACIVFDRLRTMTRALDPDVTFSDATTISNQGGWIRCGGSVMRALPCTESAMDGISARLIVADEVARMEKGFGRVVTGLSKDPASQMLCISTPDARQRTRSIWPYWSALQTHYVQGSECPAGWRGMLFGLDSDDDALDSDNWIKAQPSLGLTVQAANMKASIEAMMGTHDPEQVAECDMQILARHNDRLSGAMDLSILDRQMIEPIDWDSLRGAPAVIAIDLARGAQLGNHANLSSLCLAVFDVKAERYRYKLIHWWAGQDICGDEKRSHQPLRQWIAEGHLRQMSGEIHDMHVIEAAVRDLSATYSVRHVGVDPLAHQESALIDWRRRGIAVTAVEQGIRTMAPAWALWTDGIRGRTISHQKDPVLRACLAATRTICDNAGNVRPVKGRSSGNIDAVIASCMAAMLCERFNVARVSSYETPGGVVI